MEVGRGTPQADSPNLLEPGAKEAKATPSISLKARYLHKKEKFLSLETNDTHVLASHSQIYLQ